MITIIDQKMQSSSFKHLSILFKNLYWWIVMLICLWDAVVLCVFDLLMTKLGRDFYNLNRNKSTLHGTKSNGTVP
jgi:hypothetical protein